MSETPKTDAAYKACRSAGALGIIDPLTQCSALLERQLEEATERADNLSVELTAMTQERDELRRENNLLRRELAGCNQDRPATPEEIHAACLSYDHGYGLVHWEQQRKIACDAVEWRDAWRKAAKAGKEVTK